MKNLYRRYRPLKLAEVVGQPQVVDPLTKSLGAGKIGHAYLFVGPRGCGKTSVARILAHEVNGFNYELEDDYVDIIEIDGASNRGIDDIRELREKVMIAPTMGKYKIYIIDEVHMLTKEAFNALLKTLEEPPEHAIFIMATTDAHKVPVTIVSRAQTYTFKLVGSDVMRKHLKEVAEKEKIKISDEAISVISKRGGGSFRDSLSLLDQISTLSDKEITKDLVIGAMGLPQDEKISELLSVYLEGNVVKITTILKDLLAAGIKPETIVDEVISTIVERPSAELLPLLAKLPDVKAPYAEAKLLVALLGDRFSMQPGVSSQSGAVASVRSGFKAKAAAPKKPEASHDDKESTVPKEPEASPETKEPTIAGDEAEVQDYDWDGFVARVQELSDAVRSQLVKSKYEFKGGALHIFPGRKIVKNILSRDNNKQILLQAANGVKVTIHDENESPSGGKKDATLEKISGIMGGEVQNDKGGNPF